MRIVPARNGWQWIVAGARLWARSPLGWMALVLFYWVLMSLATAIPWVGPIIGTLLLPPFSVSFMVMAREAEAGHRLLPQLLIAGFARNRRALFTLGAIYYVAVVAAIAFSALADSGLLARYMLLGEVDRADAAGSAAVVWAGVLAMLAYTPVMMAYWFAPILAAWEDMSPGKSLFFSFFGVWRNWRAFAVYGAATAGLFGILVAAFGVVGGVLAGFGESGDFSDPRRVMIATFVAAPLLLAGAAILIASVYASYRDVFPPQEAPTAES